MSIQQGLSSFTIPPSFSCNNNATTTSSSSLRIYIYTLCCNKVDNETIIVNRKVYFVLVHECTKIEEEKKEGFFSVSVGLKMMTEMKDECCFKKAFYLWPQCLFYSRHRIPERKMRQALNYIYKKRVLLILCLNGIM